MIQTQLDELVEHCAAKGFQRPEHWPMANGGMLVRIRGIPVAGWNRPAVDALFVAPPGYPAAQPDCFWVEPNNFRLAGGQTPQNANDGNPIPGDPEPSRRTTWFSWHVQNWNPSRDSLITFLNLILTRLTPAR